MISSRQCFVRSTWSGALPRSLTAVLLVVLLAGCTTEHDQPAIPASADVDSVQPAEGTPQSYDADRLIRPDGIGRATRGMTLGELRRALAPDMVLGSPMPFMVDVSGVPIIMGTDTLYYVLVPDGEEVSDTLRLDMLATVSQRFRTAEGVGPGTTLADAAVVYGNPTLSYNVMDESREYASFARYPEEAISFRVGPGPDGSQFAGTYDTQNEFNTTTTYRPTARIWMVIVHLR